MHQQAAYMFSDLTKTMFPSPAAVIGKAITVSAMIYLAFLHYFPVRLYSGGGLILGMILPGVHSAWLQSLVWLLLSV